MQVTPLGSREVARSVGLMVSLPPVSNDAAQVPLRVKSPPAVSLGRAGMGRMLAVSPLMRDFFDVIARLAASDVTVALTGETGTGKDVAAHTIHDLSPRRREPFVVFDCGAVPPNLIESELFGHERGSFTGATTEHVGAFERARGGTLFLDEIGELPLDLQPRLLRVLDERSVRRVGGAVDRRVDVRVVAATNRDLASLVGAKLFRQDLYFRLTGASLHLPPLRDRVEDMPILVARLLSDLGRGDVLVSKEAMAVLCAHSWPGNVRELKNTLACALAFLDHGSLEPRHLRFVASTDNRAPLDRIAIGGQTLENLEKAAIKQTLAQTRSNKAQAAKLLGIAVSTLYEKLKKYEF